MPAPDLAERARQVLRANDAGRWTKPSPAQYPHQWNWDSGFASLGWAAFDPRREPPPFLLHHDRRQPPRPDCPPPGIV